MKPLTPKITFYKSAQNVPKVSKSYIKSMFLIKTRINNFLWDIVWPFSAKIKSLILKLPKIGPNPGFLGECAYSQVRGNVRLSWNLIWESFLVFSSWGKNETKISKFLGRAEGLLWSKIAILGHFTVVFELAPEGLPLIQNCKFWMQNVFRVKK